MAWPRSLKPIFLQSFKTPFTLNFKIQLRRCWTQFSRSFKWKTTVFHKNISFKLKIICENHVFMVFSDSFYPPGFHKLAQMVKELSLLLKSDSHLPKKFELFARLKVLFILFHLESSFCCKDMKIFIITLWSWSEPLRWNKKHFSSFLKNFQLQKIVSGLRVCL